MLWPSIEAVVDRVHDVVQLRPGCHAIRRERRAAAGDVVGQVEHETHGLARQRPRAIFALASPVGSLPAFEKVTFNVSANTWPANTPAEVLDVGSTDTPGRPPCGRNAWIFAALVNLSWCVPHPAAD